MGTTSVWNGTAQPSAWPSLSEDLDVDVAVIGGGITGVTAALLLARAGRRVALVEAHAVGGADTSSSTGNLYATVSGGLEALRDKWDADTARSVVASRAESVDFIEQLAAEAGPAAGFRRCPMYLYAGTSDAAEQVQGEHDALRDAGWPAGMADALPPGPPQAHGPIVRLEGQAQFHPTAYVRALAALAAASGCRIFERSAALEVDASAHRVRTASATITARDIVLATHSPSGFHIVQAGMVPHREYGLAVRQATPFVPGIFWAHGQERLSVRGVDAADGHYLVCVGEDHKTGQHDTAAAMQAIEDAARRRLGVDTADYRWSAQNFRSPDGLPYVGRDPSDCWIATGFATDGLVYGTLAARIIADGIADQPNRWSELYKATRFTPAKSARAFGEETASVVKAVVQDYLTHRQKEAVSSLRAGDGAIVEADGERLAAYRAPGGELMVVSPVCTHLKCIVHWNPVETSWDCPCHGSRFAPDGSVLEGPAIRPLQRRPLPG